MVNVMTLDECLENWNNTGNTKYELYVDDSVYLVKIDNVTTEFSFILDNKHIHVDDVPKHVYESDEWCEW